MPKIKTVRGAAKRFKKTGKGGFKHKHANLRHILTKKATKRKRHLRPKAMVSKGDLGLVIASGLLGGESIVGVILAFVSVGLSLLG